MAQPINSCCFNLSFQTNAFFTAIKRKMKMLCFLFSVWHLSQCGGLRTILVVINQYNRCLEWASKAFERDEKKIDFWCDGKSCIVAIHHEAMLKDALLAHIRKHPLNYRELQNTRMTPTPQLLKHFVVVFCKGSCGCVCMGWQCGERTKKEMLN